MTGKDDVLHLRCKNENTETYFMKNIDTCTVIDTGMLSISSLQDKNITYVIFLMRKIHKSINSCGLFKTNI